MGKFQSADNNTKIGMIKDAFNELVAEIANEPNKLLSLLEVADKPKPVVAIHTLVDGTMSNERKAEIVALNKVADEKAAAENARLQTDYEERLASAKKVGEAIAKMGKREGCICGTCFNVEATGGPLSPDFEPLIEIARKHAEAAV
jgi:hypothetical protein